MRHMHAKTHLHHLTSTVVEQISPQPLKQQAQDQLMLVLLIRILPPQEQQDSRMDGSRNVDHHFGRARTRMMRMMTITTIIESQTQSQTFRIALTCTKLATSQTGIATRTICLGSHAHPRKEWPQANPGHVANV